MNNPILNERGEPYPPKKGRMSSTLSFLKKWYVAIPTTFGIFVLLVSQLESLNNFRKDIYAEYNPLELEYVSIFEDSIELNEFKSSKSNPKYKVNKLDFIVRNIDDEYIYLDKITIKGVNFILKVEYEVPASYTTPSAKFMLNIPLREGDFEKSQKLNLKVSPKDIDRFQFILPFYYNKSTFTEIQGTLHYNKRKKLTSEKILIYMGSKIIDGVGGRDSQLDSLELLQANREYNLDIMKMLLKNSQIISDRASQTICSNISCD